MEQRKLPAPAVTKKPPQIERLNALELSLLRGFRRLKPVDQAAVFRLMDGLVALTELEN